MYISILNTTNPKHNKVSYKKCSVCEERSVQYIEFGVIEGDPIICQKCLVKRLGLIADPEWVNGMKEYHSYLDEHPESQRL